MGEARSSTERKNLIIKTLIIVVLLLVAFLSTVIYIFAYPKTTVTLHDDATTSYKVLSQFKVKKYSKLGELASHEKSGYTFLYWAYEDESIFNPNAELDMDALSLYATYSRNSYTITYHIQVYNEDAEQEGYTSNKPGYHTRTELFGETIRLPYGTVGDQLGASLLPELQDRVGYHFAGWTTKVAEEEVITASDVYNAGGDFVVPAGDVDLYAYWEKNEYEVVTHTGNQYEMEADGLTPKKDDNGNFIIKNNRVQEVKALKYLDAISNVTTSVNATLGDEDGLVVDGVNIEDYKEYEFKGWYLDENFTIPANAKYTARVNVVNGVEIPYLEYVDDYGNVSTVNSVLSGEGKYQFHLYSKWERKSYTITFNNNHSGSNGKLDPITIYKYDDHYGKFYLHTIDLKEVTTQDYLNSNKGYKFFAWSTTAQATDPACETYYQWLQDPISYDANGSIIESKPYYDFFTYRHEISEDKTFYTLWSRIRSVTFYQKNGSNRFNGASFVVEGIAKEWFKLPGTDYVVNKSTGATIGSSWTINDYQYFAGWRVGSGTTGDPILEKNSNGTDNKEYYWIFSSTSTTSVTICAYWESIEYTIEYYLNDGTENKLPDVKVAGGKKTYYAGAPSRENYIFDGWSTEKYPDNTPKSAKTTYTSANSFVPRGSERVLRFYASWTMNFTISYDLGVADESVTGNLPTGVQYSKKGKDLKLEISVGSGSTLKRTGYTFKGWVLKAQDGSYNTDIIFKAGNSLVFDFNGVNVTSDNKQGSCYIKGLAAKQYPFFMDDTNENFVVLYAYWEAKEYTITIHDTATGETIERDVKFGQDFNFAEHITTDYVGKKFIGISASETGPIQYSKELGMVLLGSDIVGDLVFYARYEIREIYIKYMIKASDANMSEDVNFTPPYGYSGYGNKPVLYNDELVLPTPSTYNPNFRFTHWYYTEYQRNEDGSPVLDDGGNPVEVQVPVYTGSRLTYEGDNLILWANYVEETYTMEFKFINPLDTTDIVTIDKDVDGNPFLVKKGSGIDGNYYAYISALLEEYETSKNIKEYTLDGLFNTYQGDRFEFIAGQLVNIGNYPSIQSSNVLVFVTVWSANDVKFVYNSGEEAGSEKNTSYHTGKNFESTDSIMLEDVTFTDLNDGESVHRWYIKNQTNGEKLYVDKGAYLIGFKGQFGSIAEMRDYISWVKVNGRYVGTINIYAETQQVFSIEYYRFNKGNLEVVGTDTHIYDGYANIVSLMTSNDALEGLGGGTGFIFNGWVVYSSEGRVNSVGEDGLVSTTSLNLDTTIFSDFKVFLYADISYLVDYDYLAIDGTNFNTVDLKTETITLIKDRTLDYSKAANYNVYHTVNSMVSLDAETLAEYALSGYEYYGYKIAGNVYSSKEINNGFTIEISSNKISILCYITNTKTVTYKLGSESSEAFTSSNLAGKTEVTYTYVIGYDNKVVAERIFTNATDYTDNKISAVTIKDIAVRKEGYIFTGWQQTKDGSVYSDIYTNGDTISLLENLVFVTYFTTPEANTIKGYVEYLDATGVLMKSVEVWNGTAHILEDGTGTKYDSDPYQAVYSWKRDGVEYRIGERFEIPLLIATGDTFEFTAVIKDKYIIAFETYTDNKPEAIVTFADVENQLVGVPALAEGIEFSHWRYELTHDDGTKETITIAHNDAIAFRESDGVTPVKYSCTAMLGGYNLHIIPVVEGVHIYTLEAVAVSEVTIKLTATSSTSTVTEEITVEYGATFLDPRELLTDEMKALETLDRGICAWTTDPNNTDITDYNDPSVLEANITRITKKGLQLYAVWQTKYTVTYALEDDTFGYKNYTPIANYYFEGDTVEFDANVVKSIYYKGFNTVYYDNGTYIVHEASGNDYYYVIGFVASFGGNTTQEYMLEDGSFKMPGNNVTLTPITKTITYRVDFMENATTTGDTTLYTIYNTDISEIDFDAYPAVRSNFKFLGWNTNPDAELPLTQEEIDALEDKNTTFYAVWASNVFISFAYNGTELFSIPLNKQGKLSEEKVEYYMSITEESVENGYLIYTPLNGSTRTYYFNNNYYYLNQYSYNNKGYETAAELCALDFTSSSTVNLMFERVFTVKYMSTNPTPAEGEEDIATLITTDYFTVLGGIGSTGIVDFTVASKPQSITNKYYETNGWLDSNSNFYNFGQTITESSLAYLPQSEEYVVEFALSWSAKSFEVILNYTATPYTNFKAHNTAEDVKNNVAWTNVASSYITDEEGSLVSTTSVVNLVYGSNFVIQFNDDILENYMLIGWSTTLYPLGFYGSEETSDIVYRTITDDYMYSYSATYVFDSLLLGDNDKLVMYPVFVTVPNHTVHVSATNGKFTYVVENDETMKSGYMEGFEVTAGSSEFDSQEINLYFYNVLTVTADKPANDYYKFSSMTSSIGSATGNTAVIKGTDTGSCSDFNNCHESVNITYVVKTVTINAKLDYERELKSISDTSTVVLSAGGSSVTLSYANKTASFTVPANSELGAVATIGEHFNLDKIMSGENALAIANNKLDIMQLTLSEGDIAELVFTLAPKSYRVTLELQGGEIGDIEYTSALFGNGVIVYNNESFEVVYDAFLTLPAPTLTKYVFNNWKVNGVVMNTIADYEVKSNLNITAYFTQNSYSAMYYLQGETTPVDVHFVGGTELIIGRDNGASDGTLISANTMLGYTHLGWTEKNKDYADDAKIEQTEKRDYTFVQKVKGEEITIKYVYNTITLATMKVEYGSLVTIPTITEVSANNVEGMKLYGFATKANEGDEGRLIYTLGQDKLEFKRDLGYEIVDASTPREITLYAVYYQKYTYTIEYASTSIATETYEVTAINPSKEVSSSDLKYTLSSIVPTAPTSDEIFAGYKVAYEISGVTTTLATVVDAGETIILEDPKNHEFAPAIKYILTPQFDAIEGAEEIKLYITDPTDTTKDLKVTYMALVNGVETEITDADYYPIKVLLTNKFFVHSTPKYEYNKALQTATTVIWTIEGTSGKTISTANANLVAYKLEGYQLSYKNSNGTNVTKDILFSAPTEGHFIAGGTNYILRPIWTERYAVRYYDANNNEIVSATEYYDQGTQLKVERIVDDTQNYDKPGFVFVGYARTENATIKYTTDFYAFEQDFTITDIEKDYNFYPAYSEIYTINFATNDAALNSAGGNSENINVTKNTAVTTYVGAPLINLADYFAVEYAGDGYTFGGFTLEGGKLANELGREDIIDEYTLNSDDLVEGTLYIYVAWARAGYKVSFVMTAKYKNGAYADASVYEVEYLHNEVVNFEDPALVSKIEALEATYFVRKNFSYAEDGAAITGSVYVQGILTIYVNFDITYTIVYNLGEAKYASDDAVRLPEAGAVGTRGAVGSVVFEYDADANLIYTGLSNLYWSAIPSGGAERTNFFDANGEHTFTNADLDYANNNYEINLYVVGSTAKYTVNLHYFKTFADLDASYDKLQTMETPDYSQLNYSVMTLELDYGTKLLEFTKNADGSVSFDDNEYPVNVPNSPFNDKIKEAFNGLEYKYNRETKQINGLFDLLFMYFYEGFESSGSVVVDGGTRVSISQEFGQTYYYAQTYSYDSYTNDIYLIYDLVDFIVSTKTYVVEDGANIINNSSLSYSELNNVRTSITIGEEDVVFNNKDNYLISATIKDLVVFTPTDASLEENRGYNFIGAYSAEYDGEGNIVFVPISTDDWTPGALANSYYIKQDNSVYVFYSEKQVKVTIQYSSPDNTYDALSLDILLDDAEAEDRITEMADGKGLEIIALYGQTIDVANASLMPYTISYFIIDGMYRFDTDQLRYELVTEDSELEEITIVVYFNIQEVNVYFYTHEVSPFVGGGAFYGEVTSITYKNALGVQYIVEAEDIELTYKYCKHDKLYYNYTTELPYGSTIIAINVNLNNYTVTKWVLNGNEEMETLNIVATDDCHIRAIYEANTINVEFYTSNIDGEDRATKLDALTISNVKYGSKINLPYAIVEEELYVSTGWNIGVNIYDWGVETNAVIFGNELLEDNVLKVYAQSINKYYIVFSNETDPSFEIPEKYKTRNELVVTEYSVSMPGSTTSYIYVNANDRTNVTTENRAISGTTDVFTGTVNIPEELQYKNNLQFGGWATKASTIVMEVYAFSTNHVTNATTHEVKLTIINSGMVVLKFHITNPNGEDIKLATKADANAEFNIDYIQTLYNTEGSVSSFIAPVTKEGSSIVQWGNFFMNDETTNLLANYEFHGWSIVRQNALNTPSTEYANISDNSALMYTYSAGTSRVKKTNNQLLDALQALLDKEYYTFYAVWETKHTVVFDAENADYTNGFKLEGKYAEGQVIPLPNNLDRSSTVYKDLEYASRKWKGWEDKNAGVSRLFADCTSGIYTLVVPAQDLNMTPIWEAGTSVIFNINFSQWREYFAETVAANQGVSAEVILGAIGYPTIPENRYTYTPYSTTTVDSKTYYTSYREGKFWSAGDVIEVFKYSSEVFSQEGIYSPYGNANYFTLLGWYIDANSNGKCDDGELIETTNADGAVILTLTEALVGNGNLTIYALWEPKSVEVKFYYTQSDAINSVENRRYSGIDPTSGDAGFTVVYVPFGGKITSVESYATDTTIFMYDGYNTQLADYRNVKKMDELTQDQVYYRFSFWSQTGKSDNFLNNADATGVNANTISSPIMDNTNLYPVFVDQYVVEFRTTQGGVISNNITQYVIDGESISVKEPIQTVVTLEIVEEIYYLDASGNKVQLLNGGNVNNSVVFDKDNYQITNDHYVIIYVHINLKVRAYIPDYTKTTPSITKLGNTDYMIGVNQAYNPTTMFTINEATLLDFGGADFAGWYYGSYNNTSYYADYNGVAYKLNNNEVKRLMVVADNSTGTIQYYLYLNGSDRGIQLTPADGGLYICLYAHFATTTTIEVPNQAYDYARLEYSDAESEYYSFSNASTSTKVIYYTAYNSNHAPEITVDLNYGYTISDVSQFSDKFQSLFASEDNVSATDIIENTFRARVSKTTENELVENAGGVMTNNLKVKFVFKVSNIQKANSLRFVLTVEYIKFNVTYAYNKNEAIIQYYNNGQYQSLPSNGSGLIPSGQITLEDVSNPLYTGEYEAAYSFSLDYTVTENGDTVSVKFAGVPYGATLQLKASPVTYIAGTNIYGNLKYHFAHWTVSAVGHANIDQNKVGEFEYNYQKYTPVLFANGNLVRDYIVTASMEQNRVNEIKYQFIIPTTTGSEWTDLVNQLKDGSVQEYDPSVGYIITWSIGLTNGMPSGYSDIKAGDDITALLNAVHAEYDRQFNSVVATSTSGGNITSLQVLLNYFWFNNSWISLDRDLNNQVCYLDKSNGKNELYVDGSGIVTIFSKLSEAVLVTTTHQTIDYLNLTTYIDKDRANVEFKSTILPDGRIANISNNEDVHVMTNSTENTIIIKVPYGSVVEFEVKPDNACEQYSAYEIYNWMLTGGDNDGVIGNTISKAFNTKDNKGQFVTVNDDPRPEYKLVANVVIDTYAVNFKNNDGNTIKTINLGYDKDIANTLGYTQYAYTLTSLYNSKYYMMPLFDLDGRYTSADSATKRGITIFNQSTDGAAEQYGEYKYLFSHWSTSATGSKFTNVISNYVDNTYKTVNLYAVYHANTALVYTVLGVEGGTTGNETTTTEFVYYLPTVNSGSFFVDMFNNQYSDSLLISNALDNIEEANSVFDRESPALYVGAVGLNDTASNSLVSVDNVKTLREVVSSSKKTTNASGAIQIYPAITYSIVVGHDDSFASADRREYSITTLGGAYSVNMQGSNLKINNLISIAGAGTSPVIGIKSDLEQQFAYWEVRSAGTDRTLEYNVSNSAYVLASDKSLNTHFNLKFNVVEADGLGYGSAKVYKGSATSGSTAGYANISLFDETPSKKYVAPAGSGISYSEDITNRKIYMVIVKESDTKYLFKIEDRTSGTTSVLYTGVYTTSVTNIDKFWWDISYDDKDTGYALVDVSGQNEIALNDADGSIVITPVVANDATINLQEGLYITNASAELNAEFANYVTLDKSVNKVSAGSRMISNGEEQYSTNPWNTVLYFVPLNSSATTSANYVSVNNTNMISTAQQKLARGTTNYRWQYKVGGTNEWRDYEEGTSLVNGGSTEIIYIRLACDWKEFLVTFSIMDTFSSSDILSTTFSNEGSSFDVANGLAANNSYVVSNEKDFYDNKQKDTLVFTLLYGIDTVEYDVASETFIVRGSYGRDYTATISLGGLSGLYSQGWYNFTNKNSGKIEITPMLESREFNLSEKTSYDYSSLEERQNYVLAAWVEKATTTNIVVDADTYDNVVNGHGTINVSVDNIKGGNNPNTITNPNVAHGITNKKTPYITINGGVSTKVWLNAVATDATTGHKFVNFSYENRDGQIVEVKNATGSTWTSVVAGNISSSCDCNQYTGTHIHVLYDATDTASTFLAVDCFNTVKKTVTNTLYGGYKVTTSSVATGTQVVITDFWNNTYKTINVVFKTDNSQKSDTSTHIYPRANYYINNTVNMKVSAGGLSYNDDKVSVTGSKEKITSNEFLLTNGNEKYNFMLGLVGYVHTLTLDLAVEQIYANGTSSYVYNWNSDLISVIKQQAGGTKTMSVNAGKTQLTISGLSYGDNIGVYYDITDGYMGMMLGIYNQLNDRVDRLFVKNNTANTLKGMDIYTSTNPDANKLVTGNYFSSSDSLDVYEGTAKMLPPEAFVNYFDDNNNGDCNDDDDCLSTLRQCSYALFVRVQERTETKVSFQMTLPYTTDLTNINMQTNLVDKGKSFAGMYAVQNNVTTAEYYVDGGIVFNMLHNGEGDTRISDATKEVRNTQHNLVIGRNFYVKLGGDGNDLVFYSGDDQYGVINIDVPVMYKFVGWYTYANNGIDVLVPSEYAFSQGTVLKSYDVWRPRTTTAEGATKIASSKVSIDSDTTIYLVLERKPVTIKYDNGEWWTAKGDGVGNSDANYDINTMLKYDYMNASATKFNGTKTEVYPGGLVTVVPTDIVASDVIIESATSHTVPKKSKEFLNAGTNPNAVIRSGLYIGIADSDALTRAQQIIDDVRNGGSFTTANTTLIQCSNATFTKGKSMAIVGDMSTKTKATTFDVLLKDTNTWFLAGVPTGDATHCSSTCSCNVRKVNMYDAPKSSSPSLIGTYMFEADLITLIQSLAIATPETQISAVANMYISKNTSSRLYNGLYWGNEELASPDKSYSNITFTYTCPSDILAAANNTGSNIRKRAILTGYTVVVNGAATDFKHSRNNSIYSESGLYTGLNLSSYGTCGSGYDVSIYPIWEALNVYKVTVVDREDTLGFAQTRWSLDGRSLTYGKDLTNISITSTVDTTKHTSSNLYTVKSTKNTNLLFSGLTVIASVDSAISPYSNSKSQVPSDFNNYGVLRVVQNSTSSYSVVQGSKVSSGRYEFTITPNQDVILGAIWLRQGYSITYQFNGSLTYGMSGTHTIDITETTGNAKKLVEYATSIEGMPFRVSEGFALSNITGTSFEKKNAQQGIGTKSDILITDGCTIGGYYSGTKGATKWDAGRLVFYSDIAGYNKDQAVIGFALSHSKGHVADASGSLISNASLSSRYGCDNDDHKKYEWLDWGCYFCTYEVDTNETSADTERKYSSYKISTHTGQYSAFNGYCMRDEFCKVCSDYTYTWYYWHGSPDDRGYLQEKTVKAATCTTNSTYYLKCSRCNYDRYKYATGTTTFSRNDKLGHVAESEGKATYSWVDASDCRQGIRKIVNCTRTGCNAEIANTIDKPFTSHSYTYTNDLSKKCTTKGSKVATCSNTDSHCGQCGYKDATLTRTAKFDMGVIKIHKKDQYVSQPDRWNCSAYISYITFPCAWKLTNGSYCSCSIRKTVDRHHSTDTKIRIMAYHSQILYDDSMYIYRLQNCPGLTSRTLHNGEWLISFNYQCTNCGVMLDRWDTDYWNEYVSESSVSTNSYTKYCSSGTLIYAPDASVYDDLGGIESGTFVKGVDWDFGSLYPTGIYYKNSSLRPSYLTGSEWTKFYNAVVSATGMGKLGPGDYSEGCKFC